MIWGAPRVDPYSTAHAIGIAGCTVGRVLRDAVIADRHHAVRNRHPTAVTPIRGCADHRQVAGDHVVVQHATAATDVDSATITLIAGRCDVAEDVVLRDSGCARIQIQPTASAIDAVAGPIVVEHLIADHGR